MALTLFLIVVTLTVIAFAEPLGERIGIVAPVILLGVGAAVAILPQVPDVYVEPELILQLILPPLLFATAMKMPQHDFRRNFSAIFVLAVLLVLATSLCVGVVIHALVPEIPLPYAVAVGAVVSPSDAVAVGIVRGAGVNRRIISILDGEGLINDASALVLLGSALVAARSELSPAGVLLDFIWAVAGAVTIGYIVGRLFMYLRSHLKDAAPSTAISVAIPFAAYLPAEEIGASGLVATVVAGLVVAHSAARALHPAVRVSDSRTWDTLGLILESLVFVLMGLQVSHLIDDAETTGFSLGLAAGVALAVWVVVLIVRAGTVALLLAFLGSRAPRRMERLHKLKAAREMIDASPTVRSRVVRALADSAYHAGRPLGMRAGGVIVWAGMRGAVTLAAAQTLPQETPARGFLILIAFIVAAWSLIAQGATLGPVVAALRPHADEPSSREQRARIRELLNDAAADVPVPVELGKRLTAAGVSHSVIARMPLMDMFRTIGRVRREDLRIIEQAGRYAAARVVRQRSALVDARDTGVIDAADFDLHLSILDSRQLALEAMAREYRDRIVNAAVD